MADVKLSAKAETTTNSGGFIYIIKSLVGYKISVTNFFETLQSQITANATAITDFLLNIEVALANLDTDIAIATAIANFPIPEDMEFDSAFINVSIAPVGADIIYDININGATALSTKITILAGNTSSLIGTQPVFSTTTATKGQQTTVDCDQIGASTAGQNPVLVIIYKKN